VACVNQKQVNLINVITKFTKRKIILLLNNLKNNGKYNSKISGNDFFDSPEYFHQRYFLEQRRAERNGYEFTLIVFDLNNQEQVIQPVINSVLLTEAENLIFSTCKSVLRETDVVAKYSRNRLVIILPDTNYKGTQLAVKRIRQMLNEVANSSICKIDHKIKIYSYPSQQDEINQIVNENFDDKRTSNLTSKKTVRDTKSYYSSDSRPYVFKSLSDKLNYKISPKATLAFEHPYYMTHNGTLEINPNLQKAIKRCIDIILSLIAAVLFLPILLIVPILIKLTSSGPIFFKQERIGFMGKRFIIYKFRTMYDIKDEQIHKRYIKEFINNTNQDKLNLAFKQRTYKIKNDPRITPIGKFLRRTSIDEIGQLINVLKGEMSLVGPRPPIPYEVEMYDLWHRRRFLTAKPGITGLWQIYGRSATTFNEMVRLDLAYANNWSIALDLKILLKTIWAVLSMKGAY